MRIIQALIVCAFLFSSLGCQAAAKDTKDSKAPVFNEKGEPIGGQDDDKTVPALATFSECKKDAECQVIDQSCSDCCDYVAINKKSVELYKMMKTGECKDVRKTCDCAPKSPPKAVCKAEHCEATIDGKIVKPKTK